jgi:predicted 3-demethylubiquinone-9 3-methyltransferase (glyoxalase superfamily)
MAYTITQINDQTEEDILFTTFILNDSNNIMPEIRLEKQFKVNSNLEQIIENEKQMNILFYTNEFLKKTL